MSFTIFQNDETLFQAIKRKSLKSPKIDIFPKGFTHGFRPKMAIFPAFFFQAIQARKISSTMFQNEKTPLQAMKTKSLKSSKTDIFATGLTHGFGPKMPIFRTFFFQAIQARKMSSTIFYNFFLQLFSNFFFFGQFRSRKCLCRSSRTKKRLSRV